MDPEIRFEWDGKKYIIGGEAYDCSHIVLPDGTVLENIVWIETLPPQLESADVMEHIFGELTADEIADIFNACIATKA